MAKKADLDPEERQTRYINAIYGILNTQIVPLATLDRYTIAVFGRILGGTIYELRAKYSGKTSVKALVEKYNTGRNWSKEHMWPRQMVGEGLIRDFWKRSGRIPYTISVLELMDDLDDIAVVNYTTKEENDALRPFQENETWVSPEYAYQQIGVELRDWPAGTLIKDLPSVYPDLIPQLNVTPARKGKKSTVT